MARSRLLLARDIGVRANVDIEPYRNVARKTAEADLREAARRDIADWFRFEVGPPGPGMAGRDVELAGTEGPEIADESVAISALIASGDQLVAPPPSHTRGATPRIQVGIEPLADLGDDQRQR